jgi:hypothetical protein
MKKSTHLSLALCVLFGFMLAVSPAGLGQVYTPQPFSADIAMTNHGQTMTGKYFFSPPSFRMDMAQKGQSMSMIVDGSTQTSYMVMHDRHMYIETKANQTNPMAAHAPKGPTFDATRPCGGSNMTTCGKVGTETVNGRVCDKWVGADKQGHTGTAWIDQKLMFPIKGMDNEGNTWDMTNIKEGRQDAALFQPPAGYQKMDFSSMMGGMGGRPPQ